MSDQPFQRRVPFEDIPARGKTYDVEFPENALAGVAERLEVEGVQSIKAQFMVSRRNDLLFVSGNAEAELTRICVASLEQMQEHVSDTFDIEMQIVDELPDLADEVEIDLEAPEPVDGDAIDLADLAIQQISLAMEPFPRKEGAEPVRDEGEQPSLSPFAALKGLSGE